VLSGTAHSAPTLRLADVENVEPQGYRADLTLDPEKNTFSGSIVIRMDIKRPLATLWLDQKQIHIKGATLRLAGKTLIGRVVPGGDDFVGLKFASMLPVGTATLAIRYTGAVNEKGSAGMFEN
jgi:alanyl aminopeptidase